MCEADLFSELSNEKLVVGESVAVDEDDAEGPDARVVEALETGSQSLEI